MKSGHECIRVLTTDYLIEFPITNNKYSLYCTNCDTDPANQTVTFSKMTYSSSRLILANPKEPPDTHHIISRKNAFGFKLLSTHGVLKQSLSFLQQNKNLRPHFE